MAETDILNPTKGWWDELGDNPNWSYGWTRKTSANKKLAVPRLGRRYSRELMNAGYSLSLNWIDRPYSTVLRIKQFYEQYQSGYFTLIDRDGGNRHHVGNFVTEPQEVQTANGKYTLQGVVFQECPQARMLEYPSDWKRSSHFIYTVDDYLRPLVATQGNWNPGVDPRVDPPPTGSTPIGTLTASTAILFEPGTHPPLPIFSYGSFIVTVTGTGPMPTGTINFNNNGADTGTETLFDGNVQVGLLPDPAADYDLVITYSGDANYQGASVTLTIPVSYNDTWGNAFTASASIFPPGGGPPPPSAFASSPNAYEMLNANPTAGDFAQVEYVGWGFQMKFRTDASLGLCDIYVDGVLLVSALDLSTGTAAAAAIGGISTYAIENGFVSKLDLPLDKHRVKVVARNARGSASTANGIVFPFLQVMH